MKMKHGAHWHCRAKSFRLLRAFSGLNLIKNHAHNDNDNFKDDWRSATISVCNLLISNVSFLCLNDLSSCASVVMKARWISRLGSAPSAHRAFLPVRTAGPLFQPRITLDLLRNSKMETHAGYLTECANTYNQQFIPRINVCTIPVFVQIKCGGNCWKSYKLNDSEIIRKICNISDKILNIFLFHLKLPHLESWCVLSFLIHIFTKMQCPLCTLIWKYR